MIASEKKTKWGVLPSAIAQFILAPPQRQGARRKLRFARLSDETANQRAEWLLKAITLNSKGAFQYVTYVMTKQ